MATVDDVLFRERAISARREKRLRRAAIERRSLDGRAIDDLERRVRDVLAGVEPADAINVLARASATCWKRIERAAGSETE